MKFFLSSAIAVLSLVGTVHAGPQGTEGFTCDEGETLLFSCFQDIEQPLKNVGDSWTQAIQCGGNGCECVSSCDSSGGKTCRGTLESTLVAADPFEIEIVDSLGGDIGTISFKAGTQANAAEPNGNGNYVWTGRKAISHLDICAGPASAPIPTDAPETPAPTPNPTSAPLTPAPAPAGTPPYVCEDVGLGSETAFAYSPDGVCFLDDEMHNFDRWGWTIKIPGAHTGTYFYDVYAAAGQCDLSKGTKVGVVTVFYDPNQQICTGSIETIGDYTLMEFQFYCGADPYPKNSGGGSTVAPGSYNCVHDSCMTHTSDMCIPDEDIVGDELYIIAHAVSCMPPTGTPAPRDPTDAPVTPAPTPNPTNKPTPVPTPTPTSCTCDPPSNPCVVVSCNAGVCSESPAPSGTTCGPAGGSICYPHSDTCDGNGQCVPGFAPDGESCGNSETSCMYADSCSTGACVTNQMKPDGTSCGDMGDACNEPDICHSGTCVTDIFKSEGTSCGDQTITECHPLADTCDGVGGCQSRNLPGGSSCGSGETPCMNGDSCSVNGVCVPGLPKEDGTSCGDDGDQCNVADACDSGVCMTDVFMAAGTSCGDTTDSVCNKPDLCDGSGTCLPNYEAEGMVCGQEETACMYADKCDASGKCVIGGPKPAGTSCGDPTSTVCNGPDTCDGAGTCLANLVADDAPCGKLEDMCNFADKCSTGECVSTTKPDGITCGPSPSGVCDKQDTCMGGSCIDHVLAAGTVCRPADGDCDVDEMCDGSAKTCPTDSFKPSGSSCGSSFVGECDNADTCNGSGTCLENHEPDGSSCGYPGDQCMFADSCSSGSCSTGGPKASTVKCGTISGVCDVQDYCDGAGSCLDEVADSSVTCRPSAGGCDVAESCNGSSKDCPADTFEPAGTSCGASGSELEFCEVQDTCDGTGSCIDNGFEPIEYTFKCGTSLYLCGNDVTGGGCNEGNAKIEPISEEECAGLIAAVNDPNVNTFGTKCPNQNAISHYVIFDCYGDAGIKYEVEGESACSRRRLRANKVTNLKF